MLSILHVHKKFTLFLWGALSLLLAYGPDAYAHNESGVAIIMHDEKTLDNGFIEFQRGVFRIDDDSEDVARLCIPVMGEWKRVGSLSECGNPPPMQDQREISRFPNDATFLGVRNLGINTEQWRSWQPRQARNENNFPIAKIHRALSLHNTPDDVVWQFDSAKLPDVLKTPIPGAAIAVHFGGNYSDKHAPVVTQGNSDGIIIETRLAIDKLSISGSGHTGVTLAIDLDFMSMSGKRVNIPVIVNLFHPNPERREVIRSDGRIIYASSYLGSGTRYVHAATNTQKDRPWTGHEVFAFEILRNNLVRIATDINRHREKNAADLLDVNRVNDTRISSVTLRNENRHLDKGDVNISMKVDYLKVSRRPK